MAGGYNRWIGGGVVGTSQGFPVRLSAKALYDVETFVKRLSSSNTCQPDSPLVPKGKGTRREVSHKEVDMESYRFPFLLGNQGLLTGRFPGKACRLKGGGT